MIYPVEVESMQYTRHDAAPTAYPRRQTSTSSSQSASSPNFSRPYPQQSKTKNAVSTGALPLANAAPISHQTITITPKPRSSSSSSNRTTTTKGHEPTRSKTLRRPKMGTYFLTGANRGIGLEFVRQLAAHPSNTIIAGVRSKSSVDLSPLNALNTHSNIHIVDCDVSSLDSLAGLEFRVAEILSKKRCNLDFVFNVAGINATSSDTSLTLESDSLAMHMQTNVMGPAKIVQSLRRYLARGATVLNMTSGLGSLAVATEVTKCCTYSMSKAALNMLTVHQSRDLKGNGVKVICMDPGWVKTRMGGEGAVLEAKESVRGMLDVVAGLKDVDSGKFYRHDGEIVPW
ncbi:short chain dehydrogenase reductase sdr [Curvularia clavata]|uniref:Short chain dehydrogenase reductase sdr n=1 Tax=Curvularia clavata TaxID=95742 RepID=A0A9Q8Z1T2_CURCL|nr:short chain dehydrogenase reductase sdr [Curvularia clavata]